MHADYKSMQSKIKEEVSPLLPFHHLKLGLIYSQCHTILDVVDEHDQKQIPKISKNRSPDRSLWVMWSGLIASLRMCGAFLCPGPSPQRCFQASYIAAKSGQARTVCLTRNWAALVRMGLQSDSWVPWFIRCLFFSFMFLRTFTVYYTKSTWLH